MNKLKRKLLVAKMVSITNDGVEKIYYSLWESIKMRIRWKISPIQMRLSVWWQIKRGYIDKDLTPLKCPYCKSHNIETCNEQIGGWNIPDGCLTEYDARCKDCDEIIGHWAYGSWML